MMLTKTYSLGGWGGFCESVIGTLRTSIAKPTPTIDILITLATAMTTRKAGQSIDCPALVITINLGITH